MGYFSRSSFDPLPVITDIVNELNDYCVRPGLIIASSIINDIIASLKPKVACTRTVNYQEKHKLNGGIRHLQKYPIVKNKIPKSTYLKKLEYPIKICNTQLKEKGVGKILNY